MLPVSDAIVKYIVKTVFYTDVFIITKEFWGDSQYNRF